MADNTGRYITVAQVNAEDATLGLTDPQIEAKIDHWMAFIDRQTGQWFNSRTLTMRVEGPNSNVLFFPVPNLTMTSIKLNSEANTADLTFFEIFNGRSLPDNRRNPMIKIVRRTGDIFSGSATLGRIFQRGFFTELAGTWGYLEEDGSTPLEIQRATLLLVFQDIQNPIVDAASSSSSGAVKREETDLHEIEFFQPSESSSSGGESGNTDVDTILAKYKAPFGIGGSFLDVPTTEGSFSRSSAGDQ